MKYEKMKKWNKFGETQWTDSTWEKDWYDESKPWLVEIKNYITSNNKNKYEVVVWTFYEDLLLKKMFKTKSQALAFAKEYMRKH